MIIHHHTKFEIKNDWVVQEILYRHTGKHGQQDRQAKWFKLHKLEINSLTKFILTLTKNKTCHSYGLSISGFDYQNMESLHAERKPKQNKSSPWHHHFQSRVARWHAASQCPKHNTKQVHHKHTACHSPHPSLCLMTVVIPVSSSSVKTTIAVQLQFYWASHGLK